MVITSKKFTEILCEEITENISGTLEEMKSVGIREEFIEILSRKSKM
jgi:hypothetical protein